MYQTKTTSNRLPIANQNEVRLAPAKNQVALRFLKKTRAVIIPNRRMQIEVMTEGSENSESGVSPIKSTNSGVTNEFSQVAKNIPRMSKRKLPENKKLTNVTRYDLHFALAIPRNVSNFVFTNCAIFLPNFN